MALNCSNRAHRKHWVANVCLLELIPMRGHQWSPLWREFRQTVIVILAVVVMAILFHMVM